MKIKNGQLVSIVDTSKYNNFADAIEQSLKFINFNFDKNIKSIAIKPNLCNYWESSTGETTDPKFVEAIIDVFRRNSNIEKIYIVEADATAMKTMYAFKMLGYRDLADQKNVELINLCEDQKIIITENRDALLSRIEIPKILKDVDLFISVPKLKLHPFPGLTCALKNQFGCIPKEKKIIFHEKIHGVIAFINKQITPDLILVDGIICKGKTPKKLDMIMAGRDPVAIDVVAAHIAGLDPRKIRYIIKSESLGVGSTKVNCVGDDWQIFMKNFPRKSYIDRLVMKQSLRFYNLYLRLFTIEGKIFKMKMGGD